MMAIDWSKAPGTPVDWTPPITFKIVAKKEKTIEDQRAMVIKVLDVNLKILANSGKKTEGQKAIAVLYKREGGSAYIQLRFRQGVILLKGEPWLKVNDTDKAIREGLQWFKSTVEAGEFDEPIAEVATAIEKRTTESRGLTTEYKNGLIGDARKAYDTMSAARKSTAVKNWMTANNKTLDSTAIAV